MDARVKEPAKDLPRHTKISSKNQVTLPVAVLNAANLQAGDLIEVKAMEEGLIQLTRVRDPWWEAFEELRGILPGASGNFLEELRNEWER